MLDIKSLLLLLLPHPSQFYVGSVFLIRRIHLTWSSCPDSSLSDKAFLMLSSHLRFGLPLLLFPGTSITITLLPTYSSSLLSTCPYHFNLLSCTFMDISLTFAVPLILAFLILSSFNTSYTTRHFIFVEDPADCQCDLFLQYIVWLISNLF